MQGIEKKSFTVIIVVVYAVLINVITGFSMQEGENQIYSFINSIGFYQVENDEAEQMIKEKELKKVSEENESKALIAFDVSSDGGLALVVSTGTSSEEIRIYDKDMNLLHVLSYSYQHGVNYILYEDNKVCFTGFKFHGVYVYDLNTDNIDVYKWTSEESLEILHDIIVKNDREVVNGETRYYLTNSKIIKTLSLASDSTYRYLVSESGGEKSVLFDSGNTKLGLYVFVGFVITVVLILLIKTVVHSFTRSR